LPIWGFLFLLAHQVIYQNILLRYLHYGARTAPNLAVPWRVFLKAYIIFYPATFLSLAGLGWGWIKFFPVKAFAPRRGQ